jgi:hypothetical protein
MNKQQFKRKQSSRKPDNGKRYTVSPHPSSFVSAPWYPLVVRIDSPATPTITTIQLRDAIVSQLGITLTILNVRLQTVRLWSAISGSSPPERLFVQVLDPISAIFGSLTAPNLRILEQLTDYPDAVNRACIGYRYPKAQREVAILCNGTDSSSLLRTSGMGPGSVLYFYLQWRSNALVIQDSSDFEIV